MVTAIYIFHKEENAHKCVLQLEMKTTRGLNFGEIATQTAQITTTENGIIIREKTEYKSKTINFAEIVKDKQSEIICIPKATPEIKPLAKATNSKTKIMLLKCEAETPIKDNEIIWLFAVENESNFNFDRAVTSITWLLPAFSEPRNGTEMNTETEVVYDCIVESKKPKRKRKKKAKRKCKKV